MTVVEMIGAMIAGQVIGGILSGLFNKIGSDLWDHVKVKIFTRFKRL